VLPRALRNIRDGLLGLTYPEQCRVCGGPVESWDDGIACVTCWEDPNVTDLAMRSSCSKCGAQLALTNIDRSHTTPNADARFCGNCATLPFTSARACGVYSGAVEASILFLKDSPHVCPRLRKIIYRTVSDHEPALTAQVVLPVPLHHLRRQQRGFNQAEVIARLISREFLLPLDIHSLVRTKPTERHRAGMDAGDRARSVERAFEVSRPRLIQGASVLLVDDVYTTGSTIGAASRSLLEAGAGQVTVLTLARVGNRQRRGNSAPVT